MGGGEEVGGEGGGGLEDCGLSLILVRKVWWFGLEDVGWLCFGLIWLFDDELVVLLNIYFLLTT